MIEIGQTLVSLDLIKQKFTCDLQKCKGACCVEGASGAPLEQDELLVLDEFYLSIKPYLTPEGIKSIEKHGVYVIDSDGDYVTPLIHQQHCAYSYIENDVTRCAIEKAFSDGVISFRKPLSCFLYPVRITMYKNYEAVNYDENQICKDAVCLGKKTDMPVYMFLKQALIQKYGEGWFNELELVARTLPPGMLEK